MFEHILTVCTGNICRSPLAEALLRRDLAAAGHSAEVRSAGIGALIGHPADSSTAEVALANDVSLAEHRGRQIDTSLTRWADLILCMEQHHLDHVLHLDPTARGKTFLLGHWSKTQIPDPYKRGIEAHQLAYSQIAEQCQRWLARL